MQASKLSTPGSVCLDCVRFSAALVVALGHVTEPFFSTEWPDLTWWAIRSVAVFFVLSGFVIRYISTTRENSASDYWIARFSRIYSVVLPAVIFTIVADLISWKVNPTYYLHSFGQNLSHPLFRIAFTTPFTVVSSFCALSGGCSGWGCCCWSPTGDGCATADVAAGLRGL